MDKFIIIKKEDADLKNIYISNEGIKAIDKNFDSKELFLNSFQSEANGVLDFKDDIKFMNIVSISTFNDDNGLQIKYTKRNGKIETSYLEFDSEEDLNHIKQFIIEKSKLKKTNNQIENIKNLNKVRIITFLSITIMFSVYYFLKLPTIALFIISAISLGLLYWLKITVTKKDLEDEKFVK